MADEQVQAVPPLPPKGNIVSKQALYLTEISLWRNALAFSGTRNPSAIWASMVYNQPWTIAYYRELEEKDEDVSNALDMLKLSVTERARSVQPANENDSLAVDIKEFVEAQLDRIDFETVLDCLLDSPGYGFSVQEMNFDTSAGQAQLVSIDDCPQELFLFANRYYPQIGNLQYLEQPWASEGTEVPEQKFLIASYRKRARNRMGRPLLKSLFWPSWFKRSVQRLWLQYAEKGPGTAVVRYNDADNEQERQQAVDVAQAVAENVAVAVPKGLQIETELLKSARSISPDVHEHLFKAMQYSIVRRVLGETLTSFGNEDGAGSKAQGETHADTFEKRSVALSKFVMQIVNQQLVRPLVLWNYGPDAPMPKWTVEITEGEDLVKRLAVDAGLQRMGKKFTVGYIVERYDVPLAAGENGENPEDILVPNAAAPQVAIADQARATFVEGSAEAQAHEEMRQFDHVMKSLYDDSLELLSNRQREIVRAAVPIQKGS